MFFGCDGDPDLSTDLSVIPLNPKYFDGCRCSNGTNTSSDLSFVYQLKFLL